MARRKALGFHHNLFLELQLEDPNKYRRCMRMNTDLFEDLLQRVTPLIQKQNTHLRESISPAERLSVTLRHLATASICVGETQESLSLTFRMGQSTISGIIRETSVAIYEVLKDEYLRFPASTEEWKNIAYDFGERWNFSNCIGAMDGKHFHIEPPLNSGSLYYCYKDYTSIVLLAMVDAQLRFVYVDVGTNGRISDSGIWNKCSLKPYLEQLNIPPTALPGTDDLFPYIVVGDEGFPLSQQVLIPYPKELVRHRMDRRIFNYRLSRARRCSENSFGLLVARFQIFRSAMRYDPGVAKNVILSTLCLHNWLRSDSVGKAMYSPPSSVDCEDITTGAMQLGEWRNDAAGGLGVAGLAHQGGNRHANVAMELRNRWCDYFNREGAVPWQERMVTLNNSRR
ncbi:hypothetical protein ONE63_011134 [Megalurothrips usitatus]|uniref:DDE Tnp4 domain-containing protein n=1 Tax=Megalurothrips usitatus TaxID=439358 RepID=A0AAV7XJF5_9NEOP|nr:hypothetical protein ONE63_011134 [Megalurothrips usitatus]